MADPDRQTAREAPDRAAHLGRLTRALEGVCTDEQRAALQLEHVLVSGDLEALDRQLAGAHPDAIRIHPTGEALIHYAIGLTTPEAIQHIIELGADVNYVADDGFPALVNAIHHYDRPEERWEVVRVLVDAGADLERVGINGYRPIHCAAMTGDRQLVRMLLDAGADPHSRTTVDDYWTAIEEAEHLGARQGAEAIREWLAEHP
ncbi:MAG: ankyrin repeat domain-containing protein [Bacteroidota bacterium]